MKYILTLCLLFFSSLPIAAEEHEHEGHGDHDEAGANIGPDKGILEKSKEGIKLSKEAVETMAIKAMDIGSQSVSIPVSALVKIKDEKYVYRLRNGWFKRVEIQVVQKNGNTLTVIISDFVAGDKIVTDGLGFLRTSDVFSEEGATHSH
ncbi:MAG: hypothetical protein BroJett040_08140 [Oligoflexia bacterium]|nr:MAG: hypothetical protein BroJett040_08140 [Oligoflexia bacterium]